jgi:hypothetical protein
LDEDGEVGVARRRWALRLAAALGVLAVLVSGCTEKQPANDTLPPTSSSAAESEESLPPHGPEDFPLPEDARTDDESGAEAAARYFLALTTYAFENLDDEPLLELSRNCEFCESLANQVSAARNSGQRYVGGQVTITGPAQIAKAEGNALEVYVPIEQSPLEVFDSSGQSIPESAQPSYQLSASVLVMWDDQKRYWPVVEVTLS